MANAITGTVKIEYRDQVTKEMITKQISTNDIFGKEDIRLFSKYAIIAAIIKVRKDGYEYYRRAAFRRGISEKLMYYILIAEYNKVILTINDVEITLIKESDVSETCIYGWNVDNEDELINYHKVMLNIFEYREKFIDILSILMSYSDFWDKTKIYTRGSEDEKSYIFEGTTPYIKRSNKFYNIELFNISQKEDDIVLAKISDCVFIDVLKSYGGKMILNFNGYNIVVKLTDEVIDQDQCNFTVALAAAMFTDMIWKK